MTKQCIKCKEIKKLELFNKNKSKKDGRDQYCNNCRKAFYRHYCSTNREKRSKQQKQYYSVNTKNYKNNTLKSRFGITVSQYDATLLRQNNVCALCKQLETVKDHRTGTIKALAVDHCHVTGKLRGLLCSNCNRGLGYLRDNPELCHAAGNYLTSPPGLVE